MKIFLLGFLVTTSSAFGWGELGHQLIARTAVRLLPLHPAIIEARKKDPAKVTLFLEAFERRAFMLGHVANIPDIYWRGYDDETKEFVHATNPSTHSINMDLVTGAMPLVYADAEKKFGKPDFFKKVGTNPWRAQQLAAIYGRALDDFEDGKCETTRDVLSYAGLMAHFTGDAAQPYHTTVDHDGVATGEKGIHWYWENHLVNALQDTLTPLVFGQARDYLAADAGRAGLARLQARAPKGDDAHATAGLTLALIEDSRAELDEVRRLDKAYALATPAEEKRGCGPKNDPAEPCRREPTAIVKGKTVAQWNEPLLVERLAYGAVVTADIWARRFVRSKRPALCWTWSYALKPAFISPFDGKNFGYASDPR